MLAYFLEMFMVWVVPFWFYLSELACDFVDGKIEVRVFRISIKGVTHAVLLKNMKAFNVNYIIFNKINEIKIYHSF